MIRRAEQADLDRLVSMAREFHAESRYARLPFGEEPMRAFLSGMLCSERAVVLISGEGDGALVGMLVPLIFTAGPAFVADEVFLYVRRERRGGLGAPRLLRTFEDWARAAGAIECHCSALAGDGANGRIEALYERLGYRRQGGHFIKPLVGNSAEV